jgi:hypothetical protein
MAKVEYNYYGSWLILSTYQRKLTKVELRDWLLMACFYQRRARHQVGKLAVANKREVYLATYWPNRAQGKRADVYAMFDKMIEKSKKLGYVEEPEEGWLDLTDAGKEMLKGKTDVIRHTAARSIRWLASRWTPNTARHNEYFEYKTKLLQKE